MAYLFGADEIASALEEVARVLDRRGVRARILVFGGAAVALAYDRRRAATRDVDGSFGAAQDAVRAAAREVAAARGYPDDWLNDAGRGYLPVHGDPVYRPVVRVGEVEIAVAPPDLLLAMKLRASRGRRDLEDVEVLLDACAVGTVDDAVALFTSYFPDDEVPRRGMEALRATLPQN